MNSEDRPERTLRMSQQESALLLNLLSDNARVWNAALRAQLAAFVNPTERFNAQVALREGRV